MIEVEKKFLLSGGQERVFEDEYFDDGKYSLTSRDMWLRRRNGRFELKTPLFVDGCERSVDQYDELEKEEEIRSALDIPESGNLEQDLAKKSFFPFAKLTTTRKKFKKDGFILDFDIVDFGDSTYSIAEVEKMVEDKSQMESAVSEILEFAQKHGLESARVRGKVIEYVRRKNPDHFGVLIDCGICN